MLLMILICKVSLCHTVGQMTVGDLESQCGECRDEIHRLREEIRLLEDEVGRREAPLQLVTDDQLQRHL